MAEGDTNCEEWIVSTIMIMNVRRVRAAVLTLGIGAGCWAVVWTLLYSPDKVYLLKNAIEGRSSDRITMITIKFRDRQLCMRNSLACASFAEAARTGTGPARSGGYDATIAITMSNGMTWRSPCTIDGRVVYLNISHHRYADDYFFANHAVFLKPGLSPLWDSGLSFLLDGDPIGQQKSDIEENRSVTIH